MTDNDSEQFYQDLRRKLDGYGSAPPESVWTAIREQVPARQPKRRRPVLLWLTLLLGALLTGLALGPGRWPAQLTPMGRPELTAGRSGRPAPLPTASSGTVTSSRPVADPAATAAAPIAAAAPYRAEGATTSATSVAGTPAPTALGTSRASSSRGRQAWLAALSGRAGRKTAAGQSADASRVRRARPGRLAQDEATATLALADGRPTRRRRPGRFATAAAEASLVAARGAGRTTRRGVRRAHGRADDGAAAFRAGNRYRLAGLASAAALSHSRSRPLKLSNERLALLEVELPEVSHALPAVRSKYRRPRARRPTKRELRLRDWSVQALAGTGLTYRTLGSSGSQLEQLERPALAYSGQVAAGYAFSRQLTLTAGLGYAEYATTLRYQLQKTSQEALLQKDFRNTYRLLTIPLQAQLTLGTSTRWRYGLLGGGTAAFLVGARTTQGSACNCQQTQWTMDAPQLPFSRTNLLLTGGAFASYQFALGQWFTVQPLGQLFLNSITTPESALTARRPWALGVQAGYSWDLDPRKH